MRRAPIRIRAFLVGTVLALLILPTLAGGAAWLIERDHQQGDRDRRLNAAVAYLTSHRTEIQEPAAVHGFARLLTRLDLLAQLFIATQSPQGKSQVYVSPALLQTPALLKQPALQAKARRAGTAAVPAGTSTTWVHDRRRLLPAGTRKAPATLITDLYYRRSSRAARALAALLSGVVVLLAGLALAVWLTGRWMVVPLTRLSAQVDKVAGGDLTIAVPHSRVGEIANIAQAVEGMTAALGESAQRRAEADEARRFLVTSVAHDLRTPLFALRGHLQAIRSRLGDPAVHLERAEARADALERLVGNLFAYTRDDYAQPAPRLEAVPVIELLHEITAGLEHPARLGGNTFDLAGDPALAVIVDRDRVKRALANVLDNALRFSPAGAQVDVSWAPVDESTVELIIRDHGPGIDSGLLPHVFEAGIRGTPEPGDVDGGAGLGLTIAKRLLEHQDATLAAHNDPGGGAVIGVRLHRAQHAGPALQHAPGPQPFLSSR